MCCKLNIQVRRDSDVFPGQWHHPFLTPLPAPWPCAEHFVRQYSLEMEHQTVFGIQALQWDSVMWQRWSSCWHLAEKKPQQHRVPMLEQCVSVLLTTWGRHVIFNPLCYKMLCQQCGSYLQVITHGPTIWLGLLSLFPPVIWVMSLHNTNSANVDAQN